MIETFGVEWALLDNDKPKQFLLLLIHLCSVEVRMQLEEKSVDAVMKNADLVLSCFTTLELAVTYIGTDVLELDQKEKQQLYTALKGAFSAILTTLKKFLIKSVKADNKSVSIDEKHFTLAIIRVLAAWLAQETNAMRSTVIEVLPFILCVANDSFYAYRTWYVQNKSPKSDEAGNDENQKPTDILKALLPALCHFTVEEKAREIMLQAKEEDVLVECFSFHWSIVNYKPPPPPKSERLKMTKRTEPELPPGMAEAMKDSRAALVSMCNIFMNIIVLEPKLVENSDPFYSLLKFILNNLTDLKRSEENLVLHANMAVLGLLLLKHQAKKVKKNDFSICRYIQCTIRFLWDAFNVDESNDAEVLVVSMEYKKYWMDLMELWFLGMQTISVVLTHIPWISEFIMETGWAQGMVETLRKVRVGTLPPNTRHAYEDFLLHLAKTNSDVVPVLKKLDILTVCRNHLFMELGKFLFGD
uniref:Neurochondrin n=1 Tax=Lygus hesperus TaxID=30085 RepID=A0A0A9WSD3_LYGHE